MCSDGPLPTKTENPQAADRVPRRVTAACLCVLTFIAVVAVMAYLGPVMIPVVVAVFLYFIIHPVATYLQRWRVPPWLTYAFLALCVTSIIYLVSNMIADEVARFAERLPKLNEKAVDLINRIPGLRPDILDSASLSELFNTKPSDVYQQIFGTAYLFIENLLMVFFYMIFVFIDANHISDRILRAAPQHGEHFVNVLEKIRDGISSYMRVKTLISFGLAATTAVILWLFGIPSWFLWSVVTFLLNYITYIGSLIALVPPIVIGFLQFESIWMAVALATVLTINRSVWIDYFEIRFSGTKLQINNVLLLFSIAFWGWFWGVTGMVLAVPMLAALKITLDHFDRTRPWAILISEGGDNGR